MCAGESYSALGDPRQAEQLYLMSLSAKPNHLPAVIGYSQLLEKEVMSGGRGVVEMHNSA